MKKHRNKGFSMVEIAVVIAIMLVLLAILVPSVVRYTENSRMQRDESAMDEVCNSIFLALADSNTFDEVFEYAIPNNYITYTDSSGVYGQRYTDEEFWAPDGSGEGVTITFNPDENGDYHLSEGIVNDMTLGNGSVAESRATEEQKAYFSEMGTDKLLYNAVYKSIGGTISEKSTTYKNSSYTVFITYDLVDGAYRPDVYGSFNGTNLSDTSPAALDPGTEEDTPENEPSTPTTPNEPAKPSNPSDLEGGGTVTNPETPTPTEPEETIPEETIPPNEIWMANFEYSTQPWKSYKSTLTTIDFVIDTPIPESGIAASYDISDTTQCDAGSVLAWISEDCTKITISSMGQLKNIGDYAFCNTKLTNAAIPDSVIHIGRCAFYSCQLSDIIIPSSVITIDVQAFSTCFQLTTITIPTSVKQIRSSAFDYCTKLKSVTLSESLTSIEPRTFSRCYKLLNLKIPNSVTSIGSHAFAECTSLSNIEIPNSVTSIDNCAFEDCRSLTSVTLGHNVRYIGKEAFYKTAITTIAFPNSVETIDSGAFQDCSKLESIDFPDGLKIIKTATFNSCESLTTFTIPDSVETIEYMAFDGCDSLTSITIPSSVTLLESPCRSCPQLTAIEVDPNNPNYCSVDGILFTKNMTEIIRYPAGKTATTYEIPASVTSISSNAFDECKFLANIKVPEGVTSIGSSAFNDCTNLTSINIPSSVKSIGQMAFINCTSLPSIEILGSVTSIESSTFSFCKKLTSITLPEELNTIKSSAFNNCSSLKNIHIPNRVTTIANSAFYGCTSLSNIEIPTNATSIGSNAFYNVSHIVYNGSATGTTWGALAHCTTIPCEHYIDGKLYIPLAITKNNITKVVSNYSSYTTTDLVIPATFEDENGLLYKITAINDSAFSSNKKLSSVTFAEGSQLEKIGSSAFNNCVNLTSINIPSSVTSIGDAAFSNCEKLTNISLPTKITAINNQTFDGCTSLTSIKIPKAVTSIGMWAFRDCTNLTSVTFENQHGWWNTYMSGATSGTNISSSDLANTSTAATYLTTTYHDRFWRQS